MAEYNLGNAHGRIIIDSDTSGVDQAQRSLQGVDKSAQSTEAALNKTANGAGLAGAAIAGGLGLAVKTAANFEQGLSNVAAVSGATGAEMDKLRDKALKIGADTAFGATEAASAMEELVKAGLSVDEVLSGAADATVALAAAGGVDMPTAATIASNAMNQFGIGADKMVGVVDKIAGAANASAIDVGDFGMSLSQVGAVANLAGMSFDDTAVAIAEMGNAGIKGSDAGTSLKTMLSNLQPTTEKQTQAMMDLGLMTEDGTNQFYNAQGELKSLADIQGLLHDSTKDLSAAEKQMALETIFGSDAIRAAAVMADEGAAGYTKMNDAMDKTSAAEVAAKRMDNLNGAVEQMKGALETAGISIGSALTPMIRGLADALGGLFNWFNSLSPTTQSWIVGLLAGAAGLLLLTAGVLKTVMFMRSMIQTMQTLRILSTATQTGFIKMAATAVVNFVKMSISAAVNAAKTVASWGLAVAQTLAHWARLAAGAALQAAKTAASWALAAARTVASWALMAARASANAARVAAAWVVSNGAAAVRAVIQMGIAVAATIGGWLMMAAQAVISAAIIAIQWMIAFWPILLIVALVAGAVALIIIYWDEIVAAIKAAAEWIKQKLTELWDNIKSIWDSIINFFKQIPGWIGGVFSGAASWLVDKGRDILSGLWSGVKNMWTSVIGWIQGVPGWIGGVFSGAASWLFNVGKDLITGLWNGIKNVKNWILDKISGFVDSIVTGIKNFFGIDSPSKVLADEVGAWLPPGIAVGIEDNASSAIKAAADLANSVAGTVGMTVGGSDAFWDGQAMGSGYVPPSREVASYAASQGAGGATDARTVNFNTYNPVAEKASDSEARRLRALSALGAF